MKYTFFDYSVSENIEIYDFDIMGIEPSAEADKVFLVNTDGLAYEISKAAWEASGLKKGSIYESCKTDIHEIPEELINELYELGWLDEEECDSLLLLKQTS